MSQHAEYRQGFGCYAAAHGALATLLLRHPYQEDLRLWDWVEAAAEVAAAAEAEAAAAAAEAAAAEVAAEAVPATQPRP